MACPVGLLEETLFEGAGSWPATLEKAWHLPDTSMPVLPILLQSDLAMLPFTWKDRCHLHLHTQYGVGIAPCPSFGVADALWTDFKGKRAQYIVIKAAFCGLRAFLHLQMGFVSVLVSGFGLRR